MKKNKLAKLWSWPWPLPWPLAVGGVWPDSGPGRGHGPGHSTWPEPTPQWEAYAIILVYHWWG